MANSSRYLVRMTLIFNCIYKKQQYKIFICGNVLAAECR